MTALRYHPDPAQRELVGGFDRALDTLLPPARLHAATGDQVSASSGLADLGLFGIALAEASGGAGLGAVEEALLAERLGRGLASPRVFATLAAMHANIGHDLAGAIANGSQQVVPAWGDAFGIGVAGAIAADFVLLNKGDALSLHRFTDFGTMKRVDDCLWLDALFRTKEPTGAVTASFDAAAALRVRLINAAALAGMAGATCDMAVTYAKMREQFGRAIGSFQAVKHQCAAMAMKARAAVDQATFAAVAIDDGRCDAEIQVECALLIAMRAALDNTRGNIQVHGGIGFSDEADPHLFLKRAHLQVTIAGGVEAAVARVAAAAPAM